MNDSMVYAVGISYINGTKGLIWKTSDGGTNWVDISPNLADKTLTSVWFVDTEVCIITGYDGNTEKGMILITFYFFKNCAVRS